MRFRGWKRLSEAGRCPTAPPPRKADNKVRGHGHGKGTRPRGGATARAGTTLSTGHKKKSPKVLHPPGLQPGSPRPRQRPRAERGRRAAKRLHTVGEADFESLREDAPPASGHAGHKKKSPKVLQPSGSQSWRRPTLPHGVAVPSARVSLTSLFGMGRGGSSPL